MNAIFLTLFVSSILVGAAILLFAFLFAQRNHEQSDRLALLPLAPDAPAPSASTQYIPVYVHEETRL